MAMLDCIFCVIKKITVVLNSIIDPPIITHGKFYLIPEGIALPLTCEVSPIVRSTPPCEKKEQYPLEYVEYNFHYLLINICYISETQNGLP